MNPQAAGYFLIVALAASACLILMEAVRHHLRSRCYCCFRHGETEIEGHRVCWHHYLKLVGYCTLMAFSNCAEAEWADYLRKHPNAKRS
jgi:hypothetical protein